MAGAVAAGGDAAHAGLAFDPDELAPRLRSAHARHRAQLAAQPDGQGVLARGARGHRAALRRARRGVHHRRGLRAPRLRRKAPPDGDASRDARAHDHDLVLGKTFSLTGWKIGWACAPPELAAAVRAAHQFVTFATATPLQHGAAAALGGAGRVLHALLSRVSRASATISPLACAGRALGVRTPQGTYFICADFRAVRPSTTCAFCTAPRSRRSASPRSRRAVFYERSRATGKSYVRFAFCKKEETLRAAVERLGKLGS